MKGNLIGISGDKQGRWIMFFVYSKKSSGVMEKLLDF